MRVVDVLTFAVALVTVGGFLRLVLKGDRDAPQHAEDDARAFFDAHGHWPDESVAEAVERARRGADAERSARAAREVERRARQARR